MHVTIHPFIALKMNLSFTTCYKSQCKRKLWDHKDDKNLTAFQDQTTNRCVFSQKTFHSHKSRLMCLHSWLCVLWCVTKDFHFVVVVVLRLPRLYPSHCPSDLFKAFLCCIIKISSQSISDEDSGQHSSRL